MHFAADLVRQTSDSNISQLPLHVLYHGAAFQPDTGDRKIPRVGDCLKSVTAEKEKAVPFLYVLTTALRLQSQTVPACGREQTHLPACRLVISQAWLAGA